MRKSVVLFAILVTLLFIAAKLDTVQIEMSNAQTSVKEQKAVSDRLVAAKISESSNDLRIEEQE